MHHPDFVPSQFVVSPIAGYLTGTRVQKKIEKQYKQTIKQKKKQEDISLVLKGV